MRLSWALSEASEGVGVFSVVVLERTCWLVVCSSEGMGEIDCFWAMERFAVQTP